MRNLILLFILSISYSLTAQNFKYDDKTEKYILKKAGDDKKSTLIVDEYKKENNGGIKIRMGDKWGLIKYNGEVLIEPGYEDINSQINKLHIVKINGKYGVIDLEEKLMLEPIYDQIDYYNEEESLVKLNGEWGLLKAENFIKVEAPAIYCNPQTRATIKKCVGKEVSCYEKTFLTEIYSNLRYPAKARENGIQGTALAELILSETGVIEQVRIVDGVSPEIDEEVIRTLSNINLEWIPAMDAGKNVKYKFYMPVNFKLQ